jgi:heme O synthase-like polyprenyltransferase
MPYGFIVLAAGAALVLWFDFATEASWIGKAVVSGLFLFALASMFGWVAVNPLIGWLLLAALGIFVVFYRIWRQARLGG